MKYKISYGGALIGNEEKRAIMRFVDKNWWPLSKEGEKLEKETAQYLGVKHGILANSGSSAGLIALSALELPVGSEVIIPATTFPTIFNIIVQCGLVPVVVDSKLGTYTLDPNDIEGAVSEKTKAIICVHAVGNPCDMVRIVEIAKKHNLIVIEDNCDGFGGSIGDKKIGSFGDISFTSFHAAHIVAMGQGGGVFTNDDELARKVRMYRDWGRQSDIKGRRVNGDKWPELPPDYDARFIYEKIGYNLSPLELQAAMGRIQLRKTEKIRRLRQRNFDYLYKKLKHLPLLMPSWVAGAKPSWFSFPVSVLGDERGELVNYLEKNGVETRSMFAGNILRHPAYKNVIHRVGSSLVQAEEILKKSFWVSVHPRYSTRDLDYMINLFKKFYVKYKNIKS